MIAGAGSGLGLGARRRARGAYAVNIPAGASHCLSVADSSDFDFGSGAFTIEMRVKSSAFPSGGSAIFAEKMGGLGAGGFEFYAFSGGIGFNTDPSHNPIQKSAPGYSFGVWHHVAVTRTGNTWTLYLDGASLGSATSALSVAFTVGNVRFGNYAVSDHSVMGPIGDVRAYKGYCLTAAEILSRYKRNSDITTSRVLKLDFSAGAGATVADRSGLGHDATLVGSAAWVSPGWPPA